MRVASMAKVPLQAGAQITYPEGLSCGTQGPRNERVSEASPLLLNLTTFFLERLPAFRRLAAFRIRDGYLGQAASISARTVSRSAVPEM